MHVNVAKESYSPSTVSSLRKAPNVQSRYISSCGGCRALIRGETDSGMREPVCQSSSATPMYSHCLPAIYMTMIPNLPPPPAILSWLHVQLLIRCCWIPFLWGSFWNLWFFFSLLVSFAACCRLRFGRKVAISIIITIIIRAEGRAS